MKSLKQLKKDAMLAYKTNSPDFDSMMDELSDRIKSDAEWQEFNLQLEKGLLKKMTPEEVRKINKITLDNKRAECRHKLVIAMSHLKYAIADAKKVGIGVYINGSAELSVRLEQTKRGKKVVEDL